MYVNRLNRVKLKMREKGIDYLLVSNPMAIYYLSGVKIEPHERFFALLIDLKKEPTLFLNNMFVITNKAGYNEVWLNDVDNCMIAFAEYLEDYKVVGVDKDLKSCFLISLIELKPQNKYINGSIAVDDVRIIKDNTEQDLMKRSSLINDVVMEEIIGKVKEGITETRLKDELIELYKKHGADRLSFDPVISFGKNAADPHNQAGETVIKNGDCVLIDIGGIKDDYCSDMTRTVFFGEPDELSKEIYEIVKEANRLGIQAAQAGAKFCDVDKACRDYINKSGYGKYFTHRTGHCIGLTGHEYGDVSSINNKVIESGMIFSVEPGIYIKDKLGVRIEDLVLITESGNEVLNHVDKSIKIVN